MLLLPALPPLPPAPSWFPGHMARFARVLPAVLARTDVVLELRDARLPLTSMNRVLEGALRRWRAERGRLQRPGGAPEVTAAAAAVHAGNGPLARGASRGASARDACGTVCEHIVVLNKRDLVPEWGLEPFRRAMASKYPDQKLFFASWRRSQDLRALNELLVGIAKTRPLRGAELNVLVVGMPNVGKSTLLNALRNVGIRGPTPKALRTSGDPGLTRAISTRLKISEDPPVYAHDTPGVMLPYLGPGSAGAERGAKLALIAGIKEGLYDVEPLAEYLLYRLNVLNPTSPAYLQVLPQGARPTTDVSVFLEQLARRLGMLKRGGAADTSRAGTWFVRWWREEGGRLGSVLHTAPARDRDGDGAGGAPAPGTRTVVGWGFDFEWTVGEGEMLGGGRREEEETVRRKMEECIEVHMRSAAAAAAAEEEEGSSGGVGGAHGKSGKAKKREAMASARRRRMGASASASASARSARGKEG